MTVHQDNFLNVQTFQPSRENTRSYRDALGRFGTGVTIVTTMTPTGPIGMTVNSFASVSLDPALVLWSPAKTSGRFPHFEKAQHYAIHVLAREQQDVSNAFAKYASPFDTVDWTFNEEGVPIIAGALARFECRKTAAHDAGDHLIVVGQVLRAALGEGQPLLFFGGSYGEFSKSA